MTNLVDLPQASARLVLDTLLRRGPTSRAELARLTALSKQTISGVMRELESQGWVTQAGQTQGPLGRSAATYELREASALALGIDLGGTKLHVALTNLLGRVLAEAQEPTDPRGGQHVVEQIGRLTDQLAAQASAGRLPAAAALGCPGITDPVSGGIDIAPNIPDLDAFDVAAALERRLGCPVRIENDVNLAALGEQWQGSGADLRDFVLVALGTGIGMGIIADGRLVRGGRGAAGEIAYLPIGADPFDSRLYRHGTLETALASRALLERYRGFGGAEAADVRDVFARLVQGDKAAEATLDETARLLLQALLAIAAVLDPQRIVLGGSIGVRPELVERVQALASRKLPLPLSIVPSALGSRGTLIGAIGAALARLHETLFGITGATPAARAAA